MATTILLQTCSSTDTVLNIADGTGFAISGGIVTIESEQILYVTASPNQLIGCTRGYNSTTAVSHLSGKSVTFNSPTPHPDPDNGVDSIQADSGSQITGPVTLASGTNISLSETGQTITVNSSGGGTPGGTTGAVQFNEGGVFTGDASNLFWDSTNHALGIGTGTPFAAASLDVTTSGILFANELSLWKQGSTGASNSDRAYDFTADSSGNLTIAPEATGVHLTLETINTIVRLSNGGGVEINDTLTDSDPVASAVLEVDSITRGFLPPRMTTTQKNAITSPAAGLMVYDTTLNKLSVFTGSVWETITSA